MRIPVRGRRYLPAVLLCAFLPAWAGATDLLERPATRGREPGTSAPARRVALQVSAFYSAIDDVRETYGMLPGASLAVSRALNATDWVELGVGIIHRNAAGDRDPTFVRSDAGDITIIPIRAGIRIRGGSPRPVRAVFGLDFAANWVRERSPEGFGSSGARRHSGTALGGRILLGPEVTLPWHGLIAGFDFALEVLNHGEPDADRWNGHQVGMSCRMSFAHAF